MKKNKLNCRTCPYSREVPGSSHHLACTYRWAETGFVPPVGSVEAVSSGYWFFPYNFDPRLGKNCGAPAWETSKGHKLVCPSRRVEAVLETISGWLVQMEGQTSSNKDPMRKLREIVRSNENGTLIEDSFAAIVAYRSMLVRLLNSPDLSLDNLEDETKKLISEARNLLG